ncbi:hypothetical protein C492_11410 [Natronococcus jeotgali DSM 18795]|uniref:Uncharacterized protein n=1 Tax=Natronococcus jeotgali DSM 18795 TaxID=1227498 RepID=L9XD10_9EURY|nr:hypothetical protein C492_11410 [Natronococcus jeotgali DSM 18795]
MVAIRRPKDLIFGIVLSQYPLAVSNKLLKLISIIIIELSRSGADETNSVVPGVEFVEQWLAFGLWAKGTVPVLDIGGRIRIRHRSFYRLICAVVDNQNIHS